MNGKSGGKKWLLGASFALLATAAGIQVANALQPAAPPPGCTVCLNCIGRTGISTGIPNEPCLFCCVNPPPAQ